MRCKKASLGRIVLTVLACSLFFATHVTAQETILYRFMAGHTDGGTPLGPLVFDASGNLYGTTFYGEEYNDGSVFKLSPTVTGEWTETVLHVFGSSGDGQLPRGVIFNAAGNLYGATEEGGVHDQGTIFELSPANGTWTETLLHQFGSGHDGQQPVGSLVLDVKGNLYGTTSAGGLYGSGTVFKLTPSAGGRWVENILHDFKHDGLDGIDPFTSLIFDSAGNLYGTTYLGGVYNKGAVFELTPGTGGPWTEVTLYSFGGFHDGKFPDGGVIFDGAGNLYGTTAAGGDHADGGTAFELSPNADGVWTETILHDFGQSYADGNQPDAGLTLDTSGNLYGTTSLGGTYTEGTVFELTPASDGTWNETILHRFGSGNDGVEPQSPLIFDAAGNLYSTTSEGGGGTVFELAH